MKTIQFEQLNILSLAEGKFDKAIVPLVSCESHGDCLPFGTDAIIARKPRDALVDCLVGVLKRMDEQNRNIRTREG